MNTSPNTPAGMDAGNVIIEGSQGRWAGEQLMAAMDNQGNLSPEVLRTNSVLRRDEWIIFDNEAVEGALARLRAVADVIGAGLTKPIANSMGKTILQYNITGDLADATVSMDGMVRTNNDRPTHTDAQLPIPITHKDWFIPLRTLAVSRNGGEGLDTTMIRMCGRKCAEMQEYMLLNGGKQFAGLPIYGYRSHPYRHTSNFGTNGSWSASAKTGDNMYDDLQTALDALRGDRMYGPYWVYVPHGFSKNLDKDFKANGSLTVRQRLLQVENVTAIRELDYMPADEMVIVQAQRETVVMVQGEGLQNVQWDIQGGFGIEFKTFQIQVPLVRAMDGQSGIFHFAIP